MEIVEKGRRTGTRMKNVSKGIELEDEFQDEDSPLI